MSNIIDKKVVEMKFDNSNFEKNVKTSMSTLEKLQNALDVTGSTKALEELGSASNHLASSGLASTIGEIGNKFTALEVIAFGALNRIGQQAIDTGEKLVKSLSTDNISAGWSKFEEKTRSVGTLISQGFNMDEVTEQLDRLAWFTDETSYNFTEMVSSIAKFTATGQGLTTSVNAMEGIALWAAMSGQNAQKASSAMYQLSQAMGSGLMRKEDYKSIQTLNMDTDEFRQKALDAGVALGTLKKVGTDAYQSLTSSSEAFTKSQFADHLTKDTWFTSDVMMSVFKDYSKAVDDIYEYAEEKGITASEAIEQLGDKVDEFGLKAFRAAQEARTWGDVVDSVKDAVSSTWMTTFEMIFGNYEEATELFTRMANDLYDVFAEGGNQRNEVLQTWKDLGGRTYLIEALYTAAEKLASVLNLVKEALFEIFPQKTADELVSLTTKFYNFINRLKMSDETAENLKWTFKGLFSIIKIVTDALGVVIKTIFPALSSVTSFGEGILKVTGSIGKFITGLSIFINKEKLVEKAINGIKTALLLVIEIIVIATYKIYEFVKAISETKAAKTIFTGLTSTFTFMISVISTLITKVVYLSSAFASLIYNAGSNFFSNINNSLKDFGTKIENGKTKLTSLIDTILNKFPIIKEVFNSLKQIFGSIFSKWGDSDLTFYDRLKLAFESLKEAIIKTKEAFINFFGNIDTTKVLAVLLTASILILCSAFSKLMQSITGASDGIKSAAGKIGTFFSTLTKAFSQNQTKRFTDSAKELATAIAIMAASLIVLAKCGESTSLWPAFGMIASIMGLIIAYVGVMAILNKTIGANSSVAPASILAIASSIAILTVVISQLNKIDVGNGVLSKIGYIGLLLAELVTCLAVMNLINNKSTGKTISSALGLIVYALSLKKIVDALSKLSEINLDVIHEHLIDLVVIIGLLSGLGIAAGNIGIGSIIGLLTIAGIMVLIGDELAKIINQFDPNKLIAFCESYKVGLIAFVGVLTALAFMMNSLGKGIAKFGSGLIGVSVAMLIILGIVKLAGKLSNKDIVNGIICLTAFATFITVLELFSYRTHNSQMVKFAASMLIISGCLYAMLGIMAIVGLMTVGQVIAGIAIIGAFTLFIGHLEKMSQYTKNIKIGPIISLIAMLSVMFTAIVFLSSIFEKNVLATIASLFAMTRIVGLLTILLLTVKEINKKTEIKKGTILSIIGITAAIATLMAGIVALVKVSNGENGLNTLATALFGMTVIFIAFSLLLKTISSSSGLGNEKTYLNKIKMIVSVCASLSILMVTIRYLADSTTGNYKVALASLGTCIVALMLVLWVISEFKDADNAMKNAESLIVLSGVVLVLAHSLKLLAGYSWRDIGIGLASAGIAISSLIGIMFVLSTMRKHDLIDPGTIVDLGVLVLELLTVAVTLKLLAGYSWGDIGVGLTGALGSLAIMVAMMAVISQIGKTGEGAFGVGIAATAIIALAASFLVMASSCYILSAAFSKFIPVLLSLKNVDCGELAKKLAQLAAGIASISKATAWLTLAAIGILSVGAAALMIATAAKIAGAAIPYFVAGLDSLFDTLEKIKKLDATGISISLSNLSVGIANIGTASSTLVPFAVALGIASVAFIFSAFAMKIAAAALPAFTTGLDALIPLLQKLTDLNMTEVAYSLMALAVGIAAIGVASITLLSIAVIIGALSASVLVLSGAAILLGIAFGIVTAILPYFINCMNSMPDKERLLEIGEGLLSIGKAIVVIGIGSLVTAIALGIFATAVILLAAGVGLLSNSLETITPVLSNFSTSLVTMVSELEGYDISGLAKSLLLMAVAFAALGVVSALFGTKIDSLSGNMIGLGDSIKQMAEKISSAIDDITSSISDGIDNITSKIDSFKSSVGGFFEGLPGNISSTVSSVKSAFGNLQEFLNTRCGDIGKNIAKGVSNGIDTNEVKKTLFTSTFKMRIPLLGGFASGLDMHSPSKDFEKLGIYIPEGVAVALDSSYEYMSGVMENFCEHGLTIPAESSIGKLVTWISDKFNSISSLSSLTGSNIVGQFKNAYDAVKGNGLTGLFDALGISIEDVSDIVDDFVPGLSDLTDGLDGITDAVTETKSAFDTLKDTVSGQIDIFNAFDDSASMSADELLSNMQSQVEGVAKWAYNVAGLADKGISTGLLEKLGNLGPQGAKYVNAFMEMTSDQIAQANQYFADSLTLPTSSAALITDSWSAAASWIEAGLDEGLSTDAGVSKMQETALNQMIAFKEKWGINSPAKEAIKFSGYICEGFVVGLKNNSDTVAKKMSELAATLYNICKIKLSVDNFSLFGKNIVDGIYEGINKNADTAIKEALRLVLNIYTYIKTLLKMNPQSEVFEDVGKSIVYGIIYGMIDSIPTLYSTISSLVDTITSGFSSISDSFSDINATIKPELDLTNLTTGNQLIDDLLSSEYSTSLAGQVSGQFNTKAINDANYTVKTDNTNVVDAISDLKKQIVKSTDQYVESNGDVNINVELSGDAADIFKVVKEENNTYYKQHGKSPLLT